MSASVTRSISVRAFGPATLIAATPPVSCTNWTSMNQTAFHQVNHW